MRYTCKDGLIFGISAEGSVTIIKKCGGIIKRPLHAVSGIKRIPGYGKVTTEDGEDILEINRGYAFVLKKGAIERIKFSELKNDQRVFIQENLSKDALTKIKRRGFRIYPGILIEGSGLAKEYAAQKSITKNRCTKKTKGEIK